MKKVVVFGHTGQLGTDLMKALEQGGQVEVIGLSSQECDVRDEQYLWMALDMHKPDTVINCTAYHNLADCEKHPHEALVMNAMVPANMAIWCQRRSVQFVHFSTDYVFDGIAAREPYREESPWYVDPLQKYGRSKRIGEQMIFEVNDEAVVIRTASLYGKAGSRGKGGNFVETVLKKMRDGERMEVVNNVTMSPTWTNSLAWGVVRLLNNAPSGLYHMVDRGAVTWYRFACAIRDMAHLDGEIEPVSLESRKEPFRRPWYSALDSGRIQVHGVVMPTWEESLKEYLR